MDNLYFSDSRYTRIAYIDENGKYHDYDLVSYKEFTKFNMIDNIVCDDNPDNIIIFDKKEFDKLCGITIESYKRILEKIKTKKLSVELFNRDKNFFPLIPDKHKTKEMCLDACKFNINFILNVPLEFRTQDLYSKALQIFESKIDFN